MATDLAAYRERIAFLRKEGLYDGIILNPASLRDFEQLVLAADNVRRAGLVLMDNGNLRAIWDHETAQIGLQFMGEGEVQYVVLRREAVGAEAWGVAGHGRDSLDGIGPRMTALSLEHLLYDAPPPERHTPPTLCPS